MTRLSFDKKSITARLILPSGDAVERLVQIPDPSDHRPNLPDCIEPHGAKRARNRPLSGTAARCGKHGPLSILPSPG